ncbi:MAG: hypothetical protein CR991_10290 [Proteobacteria bacterium]|nr:MAG: hypothetical protein CR991_10290 [Pseudomonadota bacterium]
MNKQVAMGALLMGVAMYSISMTGKANEVEIPVIVSDTCDGQYDANGAMRCTIRYSNDEQDIYWVKEGQIYWHYPINDRVPSGGRYPLM